MVDPSDPFPEGYLPSDRASAAVTVSDAWG
jgi:hypothetical protein